MSPVWGQVGLGVGVADVAAIVEGDLRADGGPAGVQGPHGGGQGRDVGGHGRRCRAGGGRLAA